MHGISTKDKTKMGAKQITTFLIVVFFHFYHPASLFPLEKNSTSGKMGEREMNEQSSSIQGDGSGIASRSNFASGAASAGSVGVGARGTGGGRVVGGGEEGNGGGSTTPSTGAGGAAVIPLYAAGAANGHHNSHHGAASCNRSCVGFPTLCAVIFTSLLVHIYAVLGS